MQITIKELEKVVESELNLGHFYVLSLIHYGDNELITKNILIIGWINALVKKNLILNINNTYELTEKGKEQLFNIIEKVKFNKEVSITKEFLKESLQIIQQQSLEEFSNQLHAKIIDKIERETGKSNFKNNSGKMLNSSKIELFERLESFFKKYKNINAPYDKIEKVILKYVEEACLGINKYAVRLIFFIWNNKSGSMISEMLERIENLTNEKEEVKQIIDTKQYF